VALTARVGGTGKFSRYAIVDVFSAVASATLDAAAAWLVAAGETAVATGSAGVAAGAPGVSGNKVVTRTDASGVSSVLALALLGVAGGGVTVRCVEAAELGVATAALPAGTDAVPALGETAAGAALLEALPLLVRLLLAFGRGASDQRSSPLPLFPSSRSISRLLCFAVNTLGLVSEVPGVLIAP
jgi:hypothetical protein